MVDVLGFVGHHHINAVIDFINTITVIHVFTVGGVEGHVTIFHPTGGVAVIAVFHGVVDAAGGVWTEVHELLELVEERAVEIEVALHRLPFVGKPAFFAVDRENGIFAPHRHGVFTAEIALVIIKGMGVAESHEIAQALIGVRVRFRCVQFLQQLLLEFGYFESLAADTAVFADGWHGAALYKTE